MTRLSYRQENYQQRTCFRNAYAIVRCGSCRVPKAEAIRQTSLGSRQGTKQPESQGEFVIRWTHFFYYSKLCYKCTICVSQCMLFSSLSVRSLPLLMYRYVETNVGVTETASERMVSIPQWEKLAKNLPTKIFGIFTRNVSIWMWNNFVSMTTKHQTNV